MRYLCDARELSFTANTESRSLNIADTVSDYRLLTSVSTYTMHRTRTGVTKTYQVGPTHAGLVKGLQGSGIKALRGIPGVISVKFDPRSGIPLTVTGQDEHVCGQVWAEVERRISRVADKDTRQAFMMNVFHEIDREHKVIFTSAPYGRNRPYVVQNNGRRNIYHYLRTEDKCLDDLMSGMHLEDKKTRLDWREYSLERLQKVLEKSLKMIQNKEGTNTLEFNISPGKFIFIGINNKKFKNVEFAPDKNGVISHTQLKRVGIRPVFNPLLDPSLESEITRNLQKEGFVCLNPKSPDKFTIVHLQAGEKRIHFSVTLALDDNLEELTPQEDSRLDDIKKKAIENIFNAKTIGEVIENSTKPKITFRKLSLLVHPDKNSHPGAAEAFNKLQHAFNELTSGKWTDYPVLQIDQTVKSKENLIKPPKVVSVRTKNKKINNVTFFSSQYLDMRASITVFEEDVEKLTDHVRDVLNSSWEERDSEGCIPTPEGNTGLYIQMAKQITSGYVWAKEVGDVMLEVRVKRMRKKEALSEDWQECLEIDFRIEEEKEHCADRMAEQIILVKNIWKTLCPQK